MGGQHSKRAKPARSSWPVFGILNPYGGVWTTDTFSSEEEARAHLKEFWDSFPSQNADLSRFQVIPVKITVSDARKPSEVK